MRGSIEGSPGREEGVELSFLFESGTLVSSWVVAQRNISLIHISMYSFNKTYVPGLCEAVE